MNIQLDDKKVDFTGWDWGDLDEAQDILAGVARSMADAIARDMAKVLQQQAEEDGIAIYLAESVIEGDGEGIPAITVSVDFLNVLYGGDPDIEAPMSFDVRLADLLDEMIERDLGGACNLIPVLRAMLAKLEAVAG